MVKIYPKAFSDLLSGGKSRGRLIEGFVLDYGQLKQKLENPDKQSFYFKKGLQANKNVLDI